MMMIDGNQQKSTEICHPEAGRAEPIVGTKARQAEGSIIDAAQKPADRDDVDRRKGRAPARMKV